MRIKLINIGIIKTLDINKNTFATASPAIVPQTTSADFIISKGPGCKPNMINAPSNTAVPPDPGIPNVKRGINAPGSEKLFVAAGTDMACALVYLRDGSHNKQYGFKHYWNDL